MSACVFRAFHQRIAPQSQFAAVIAIADDRRPRELQEEKGAGRGRRGESRNGVSPWFWSTPTPPPGTAARDPRKPTAHPAHAGDEPPEHEPGGRERGMNPSPPRPYFPPRTRHD